MMFLYYSASEANSFSSLPNIQIEGFKMKNTMRFLAALATLVMLSGLSGCVVIGAGIGAAAGAGTSIGVAGGAVIGGVVGYGVSD